MQVISSYIFPMMAIFSFFIVWIIGTRGITHIMGSPMGASIMSSKQAIVISAVFGLAGVLLSGHQVSAAYGDMIFLDTSQEGASRSARVLLIFVATFFLWISFARRRSSLFSCSYTVVCSLIGSSLFGLGYHSIHWLAVSKILLAWLISPFVCYFLTILVYRTFRHFSLRQADPVKATRRAGPLAVFIFITIFCFIVFYNGISIMTEEPSVALLLAVPCLIGVVFYLISVFSVKKISSETTNNSMITESNTESLVRPLALLIVFVLPFSLGANNVANGVGPLLLSLQIDTSNLLSGVQSPLGWLLLSGGVVFLSGLLFSGFRLIDELGRKFTELTPVRSFSIIIATSVTIMIGTGFGIPLSTFHTTAGGVLAFSYLTASYGDTGKMEVGRFFGSFFVPWFLTIPGTIFIAGVLHLLSNMFLA